MIQLLFGAKHTSNISTEMNQHIQILTNKQTTKSSKTTVILSQNYCCVRTRKKNIRKIHKYIYTHFESKILIQFN